MISSLLGKLKSITLGDESNPLQNGEEEEEEEDIDAIEIPMVRTGISANRNIQPATKTESQSNENGNDEVEKTKGMGIITAFDLSGRKGVIDRMYQFDTDRVCSDSANYQKGSKVEFEAERSRVFPQWQVTWMKLSETDVEKKNKEMHRFRNIVAQVKCVSGDEIEVEAGKENKNPRTIRIPNLKELDVGFLWVPGDWMQISLENLPSDGDDELPANITKSKIRSLAPLGKKTLVGKVTKRRNNYLIDDSVYYTEDTCKRFLGIGTAVRCIAIQSTQYIGYDFKDFVSWRAIEVTKSNFLHYTCADAMTEGGGDWKMDDIERDAVANYQELLQDKLGIQIEPRYYVNFPPMLIGVTAVKTLTIRNVSPQEFRLVKIHLTQDESVSQFKIKSRQQEQGGGLTLLPQDEVQFDVICCPNMMGKTKEICVFDFGNFVIGREFSVTGRSEDEQFLKVDKTGSQRPNFRKQIGEQDISKIINDRDRRRVRGSQTVRAPFFSQKRLPLNKVPIELYQIMKTQDEVELRRLYPNALQPLQYMNYLQKFRVSLWFEEIENDLRRRQYDMRNVILSKHYGNPVYYTFKCPGLLDFQPPVNIQDTIDVFDEENPNTAKFQGTITKISDMEVTCVFGDAFNEQYTGFALTIQFNLGRTNYKRCHFAVQTAVEHLGKDFLFPEDDVVIKTPRILTYEDDTSANANAEIVKEQDVTGTNMHVSNDDVPFKKASMAAIFRPDSVSASSSTSQTATTSSTSQFGATGRRVQSLRSRFVSNTASSPSTSTARLDWFNTNLNQEQKNAVRRILRGQARPLPYIIFGPPGTGKTVTLVEAIMQVNKLDSNSRVLVCAPSNAAADVIAEYLANSNQYHPGDFIRLNGFLRAGQTMLESVAPFCTDGDDLYNIAMHRLIISTCMTAGQFFSLDLSLGHFTHVFIDEAGYCTEPEAMVPTILLAKCKGGQLILAGDPNQLGPVLMSDVSQNCGLNRSLLERLMGRKLYMRDTLRFADEKYNPLVLTKLVKNYRAHPTLLTLPSRLFYDDDLIPQASYEDAFALCQDEKVKQLLVNEGVPLIFDGVQGTCTRERDSPSWCNIQEAMKVAHYVCALVQKCGLTYDDIGIITPYRKQVEKIRTALQLNLKDVDTPKVASVEEFQGGERKVIIISTVRSVNEDKVQSFVDRLGFLYQPKRFNVVITRAKALMIVIGNPHVIAENNFWLQLLRYSIELNAYTGCNLPIFLNQKMGKFVVDKSVEENDEGARAHDEDAANNLAVSRNGYANNVEQDAACIPEEFRDCEDELF